MTWAEWLSYLDQYAGAMIFGCFVGAAVSVPAAFQFGLFIGRRFFAYPPANDNRP